VLSVASVVREFFTVCRAQGLRTVSGQITA
jgi:hypothetical protein